MSADPKLVAAVTAEVLTALAHILVMKDNEDEEKGLQRFWTGGDKGLDKRLLEMAAAYRRDTDQGEGG